MGLRVDPGVPLGAGAALPELMEDVRDLFTAASSAEFVPRFRVPGLGNGYLREVCQLNNSIAIGAGIDNAGKCIVPIFLHYV